MGCFWFKFCNYCQPDLYIKGIINSRSRILRQVLDTVFLTEIAKMKLFLYNYMFSFVFKTHSLVNITSSRLTRAIYEGYKNKISNMLPVIKKKAEASRSEKMGEI